MSALGRIWATGLWTGFFPVAPGTTGSLLALALWCWLPLPLGSEGRPDLVAVVFLVAVTLLAVAAAGRAEREFGHDGGPIVVDEVVGQWITVAGLAPGPASVILGFLLFRFFDVFKPFPAGRSQRLPGGWGILADDVIAGVYSAIVLRLLLLLVPGLS
ncbi:MAG: phosphatidylglycerophosphatase A family protein [Candidatus Eiseniibacteriota bacterium]